MKSLYTHLSDLAYTDPVRPALFVCDSTGQIMEEISRATLLTKIEAAALYLHDKGLRAGDRVALELGNCTELLILSWAAWGTGIVTVPLDTKRDTEELRAFKLDMSGAKQVLKYEQLPTRTGLVSWMPNLSHEALLLFTSGTTAHPKGARLTLSNLVTNAEGIVEWLHITKNDRFLVQLPLHHINSTTFCLSSLIAGASIAIPPGYSHSHFFEQAANSAATFTSIVPSIVFDQLTRTKEFEAVRDRLKLNRIQVGSAPVVATDTLKFMKQFSIPLYQGYGQTETALRVTGVPTDISVQEHQKLVTENSIGIPLAWATVEITDTDGNFLGEGQEGELVVKGPAVMQGYIGNEPSFRDGYFLTGDIGYWKEIGGKRFFYLIGRSKEIIIKGGINISPIAIENTLKKISSDIEQVFVIGVDDKRYGEEVGAAIVWKKDVNTEIALRRLKLILLVGHELISTYETPKYLVTVRAENLPMTSTGKVQRIILKKDLTGKLESLYACMQSPEFSFSVLSPQSSLAEQSQTLYNHCWQPLTKTTSEYKKYLGEYLTLGAVDKNGTLAGQISFSYTNGKITCVSICSASFTPKTVPEISTTPDIAAVRDYLLAGHDPVINFHTKIGAELVKIIPNGRQEDKSSCGYTVLLHYPPVEIIELHGPVSNQLIQAVRILAHDVNADVYALSRPGGLAAYLSRSV